MVRDKTWFLSNYLGSSCIAKVQLGYVRASEGCWGFMRETNAEKTHK